MSLTHHWRTLSGVIYSILCNHILRFISSRSIRNDFATKLWKFSHFEQLAVFNCHTWNCHCIMGFEGFPTCRPSNNGSRYLIWRSFCFDLSGWNVEEQIIWKIKSKPFFPSPIFKFLSNVKPLHAWKKMHGNGLSRSMFEKVFWWRRIWAQPLMINSLASAPDQLCNKSSLHEG